MNKAKGDLFCFLSVLFLVVTAACVPNVTLKDFADDRTPNTSIVFGKFSFSSFDNKQVDELFHGKKYIIFQKPNSTIASIYDVTEDGYFYWELPPGEYYILGIQITNMMSEIPARIKFVVKPGENNIYIGDVALDYRDRHYSLLISNDFKNNLNVFKNKFPDIIKQPIVSMAASDEAIGSYKQMINICAPEWGVKCSDELLGLKVFGVVPVTPRASAAQFTLLGTDSPTFEWVPSTNSKASYDLIIYEASSYAIIGYSQEEIPGKVFLYEENIPSTKFSLPKKLNRKSKYYWSLRLRDNDTVSDWSRFHYYYFYVIGSSFGTNQMFTFATPE